MNKNKEIKESNSDDLNIENIKLERVNIRAHHIKKFLPSLPNTSLRKIKLSQDRLEVKKVKSLKSTLLSEENLKKCFAYILSLLDYKDSVIKRLKDNPDWKLRFPVGFSGSKSNIVAWLNEEDLDLNLFLEKGYTQISVTSLPNEIILEMDIEDNKKREAYYNALRETLHALGINNYLAIFSGNKSIHYHIFIRPDGLTLKDLETIREKFVEMLKLVFPLDVQVSKPNTPARLPFTLHPETGKEVRITYPEIHNKPIEFFTTEFPELLRSLEVWLPMFEKWIKKKDENPEVITNPFSFIGKSRLSEFYRAILEKKWKDGRKRLLCLLFCLAKKLKIPKEEFDKQIKEWIIRQYGKADSQAMGILRCYVNHWKEYNWSWRGFLRKNLLEASDFEGKEKLKEILDKLEISLEYSSSYVKSNSIIPPDLNKATKWMFRDAKREEILRVERRENGVIFWVKGVNQTIHLVTYQDRKWVCDCRGFKKNGVCSHILCSWNKLKGGNE